MHNYEIAIEWSGEKGIVSSAGIAGNIEMVSDNSFREKKWAPEHLYIAALAGSFTAAFITIAKNTRLKFIHFECGAYSSTEESDIRAPEFIDIILKPRVFIPSSQQVRETLKILDMRFKECNLCKLVTAKVHVASSVIVKDIEP